MEERLKRDARAELLELGAIGPLLEDETVTEHHGGYGSRSRIEPRAPGSRVGYVEPPFSSEASLKRVLGRLLRQAGATLTSEEGVIAHRAAERFPP